MVTSIGLGEKIPMFVIGKSASQRCFKHVRNFSCRYRSQNKAWMDGTLFEEWLHELGHKFEMQGRKVVMIDDNNCPSRSFRTESYQFTFFPNKYHFLYMANGSGGNQIFLVYYFLILLTKSI